MQDRRSALRQIGRGAALATAGWLCFGGQPASAADESSRPASGGDGRPRLTVDVVEKGNSSLLQLRRARKAVPVGQCSATTQRQVKAVLDDVSIYRKMPEVLCETDPETLEFFLDEPDVAIALWRSMGVSQMTLTETSPNVYKADGGDGSRGQVELALSKQGERVIFCTGQFVNSVAKKPIAADCVIHFRNRYERSRTGKTYSRHSATMFVSLPSKAVEATARVISPVSNRIADRNFEEVSLFVRMMSKAMRDKPGWCEQVGRGLDGISQAKIDAFLDASARVHAAQLKRDGNPLLSASGQDPAKG